MRKGTDGIWRTVGGVQVNEQQRRELEGETVTKPEAYPFLRIAKQFNVDYSDVLAIAQIKRTDRWHDRGTAAVGHLSTEVLREIVDAHRVQELIRRGRVDWQTGEEILT